eukprot:2646339-Prymnesium_polylepis.1
MDRFGSAVFPVRCLSESNRPDDSVCTNTCFHHLCQYAEVEASKNAVLLSPLDLAGRALVKGKIKGIKLKQPARERKMSLKSRRRSTRLGALPGFGFGSSARCKTLVPNSGRCISDMTSIASEGASNPALSSSTNAPNPTTLRRTQKATGSTSDATAATSN